MPLKITSVYVLMRVGQQLENDFLPAICSNNAPPDVTSVEQSVSMFLLVLLETMLMSSYENSFFPSTLKLWNELPLNIRNSSSVSQFKANVRSPHLKPSNYLYVGERKYNILLTRLRHNCSSLNSDLFNVNIIQFSNCSCGALTENVNHFSSNVLSTHNKEIHFLHS